MQRMDCINEFVDFIRSNWSSMCFACMNAGENHFETVEDLVTDGLITLFMEEHHVEDYINQGPKLVRQPAVYTRRRSAHLLKYQATGQAPLKENTGM